ncbi:MAG: hypothetical protein ACD_43C00147G0003 [uncultured bacterium]|nr:MAG: hypothetical protein ACD_43C00147G0003 [uncultured bacterium]
MRKLTAFSGLALSLLVLAGAGCLGNSTPRPTDPNGGTNGSNENAVTAAKTYAVGEEATVGDIVHQVVSVETMDTIPSSATLPEWDLIAEDLPAADGFTWVHIDGETTNNSKESQSLDSTSVVVLDADKNEFSVSTDTTIYVDGDKSPVYITLQPTQTVEWEGYFQVPAAAEGLVLKGTDLDFFSEKFVLIDLGL